MMKRLISKFAHSSPNIKAATVAVVGVWTLVLIALVASIVLLLERPGLALPPTQMGSTPEITLEPGVGPAGTAVTVRGEGWDPGSTVLIYLVAPGEIEPPNYAVAGATADTEGRFTARFMVPSEPGWESRGEAMVIARAAESGAIARAPFSTVESAYQPTDTPVVSVEPTATPSQPTPGTPTAPMLPGSPMATATTDLNIRAGPGTAYPVLSVLRTGQSAEITGVSADRGWWQVKFAGGTDGRGWVSARYVSAENAGNAPVVQSPALPPTPKPAAISDWRGEYYNNRDLSGTPFLVRNDSAVNFDWGGGAPAAGMPTDNFSARWSRNVSLAAGTYRFYAHVDDGVRLWVDDIMVIDQWHDSAPTAYNVDVYLSDGTHGLRIEYYERTGEALAQLAWERPEVYADWEGEYYNNPDLSGVPVLVRNDAGVSFDWGPNSPGPGVPADNFSARWSRSLHFKTGTYRFKVVVDDGARLWVDDVLIIDRWQAGEPKGYAAEITLSDGPHSLRLEYFDFRYDAQIHLTWELLGNSYRDWKGEYFDNRKLNGVPVLVRNDSAINFNWETGSPGPGVPADNFSTRWTREVDFTGGTYVFGIWMDDGVRLWIDDALVIDSWQDGSMRLLQAERQISEGKHRVRVEYYERSGDARIAVNWSRKQEPINQSPQAVPGGPYTVDEGSQVTLDGGTSRDPDGVIARYEWDFNYDGRTFVANAAGQTASVLYPDGPATIMIALRVTDDKGASHIATSQVQVTNVAPTAEAGGPYAGKVSSPISMAATATDPSPVDQVGLIYAWDFGDGQQGSGPLVTHSYIQPGNYTVKLTVTDKDSAQGSDTATVAVKAINQSPEAVIGGPTQGLVGETLSFSGSGSQGDGHIVGHAWDFGDGNKAEGMTVSHVYDLPGDYQVHLTVTDDDGLTGTATLGIHIGPLPPVNQPPTAVISGPAQGLVGETLGFSGSGSSDSDGNIVSYAWLFGDGTSGDGLNVTHSYGAPGKYQVRLTVADNNESTAQVTHTVQVDEPAPGNQLPTAVISGSVTAAVGQIVQFDGSGSSDSDGTIVSYAWDFGDGDTGSEIAVTHVYDQAGTYPVILTVTDDDGGLTASAAFDIQIEPAPAAAQEERLPQ